MMSQQSKRELLEAIHPRYLKANKAEKSKIIDEFVAATGYHRKYAIRVLKHGPRRSKGKRKGRVAIYRGEVVKALETVWEICGRICSRRLHPHLPEMIKVLDRHNELHLEMETKRLLLQMSRATIDRLLQPARYINSRVAGVRQSQVGCSRKRFPFVLIHPGMNKFLGLWKLTLSLTVGGVLLGSFSIL